MKYAASEKILTDPIPQGGFTLIEMSIVLIIIGLIVGGILIGKDLIDAANLRAQISQIEKYQTAVNTFKNKYNCLPGDCANAANFGFPNVGGGPGLGDGDGVLQGVVGGVVSGYAIEYGETAVFWAQLSAAGLIDYTNKYYTMGLSGCTAGLNPNAGAPFCNDRTIADYVPTAKIQNNYTNFVFVYSTDNGSDVGTNYFCLGSLYEMGIGASGWSPTGFEGNPGLTTQQAFLLDTKVDDGFPLTGHVLAQMPDDRAGTPISHPGSGNAYGSSGASDNSATNGDSTTCYDNSASSDSSHSGISGATQHYSTEIDDGRDNNCALSFAFQ